MAGVVENSARCSYPASVATTIELPDVVREEATESKENLDSGYLVICWDDPVNLMDYVTHVFQTVFGWKKEKAEFHMLEVHQKGKSVLARESMERAECYVHELQKHQLHATMEPAE
ncbi:MAG: ATP-dependent Clp protease adapter ClpS [Proteobacteria bacterium]|nr:ATP-dependent Clp protease adapter ClpS [Verrucomicrobiota bacterium]NBU09313.1 ATP-dependent Clp protease adapter ClpS [Pseudomonadota bacterium]